MTLKLIPVEHGPKDESPAAGLRDKKNKKNFNPGSKLKVQSANSEDGLKSLCLRLVHFINRGSRFTYEQVDELITGMHHSILKLQKKKQEILKQKDSRKKGK